MRASRFDPVGALRYEGEAGLPALDGTSS